MTLADKIMQLRRARGWSQEELAERLSVTRQSVSKWESGQSTPDLDKLLQIADLFSVTTDQLLRTSEEVAPPSPFATGERPGTACPVDAGGEDAEDGDADEEGDDADDAPLRHATRGEAEEYFLARRTWAPRIALGAALCILSPVALILFLLAAECGYLALAEEVAAALGFVVLLPLVACAVAIFIYAGTHLSAFAWLEEAGAPLPEVRQWAEQERAENMPRAVRYIVAGVCLCILSALAILLPACMEWGDMAVGLGVCGLLVLVAVGVYLIVVGAAPFSATDRILQRGDEALSPHGRRVIEALGTVYWMVALAGYLGYSFHTGDWGHSWIVWPVAGVLYAAIEALSRILVSSDHPADHCR